MPAFVRSSSPMAPHVEAAKRLLRELERHAELATATLSDGDGTDFLAAVENRETLLAELSRVVDVLAHQRAEIETLGGETGGATTALFVDLVNAATRALGSHEQLVVRARAERDRLAAAMRQSERPDSIANQYAATAPVPRAAVFSVTG